MELELFERVKAFTARGGFLYGSNLSMWPARMLDVFILLDNGERQLEHYRNKAVGVQREMEADHHG